MFDRLRGESGLTFREPVAETRRVDPAGTPLSYMYPSRLGAGRMPAVSAIELIAGALDMPPEPFAEYRLAPTRGA